MDNSFEAEDETLKKARDLILELATSITSENNIRVEDETFEPCSDENSQWYSFVIIIDALPDDTERLNCRYIEAIIDDVKYLNANQDIIFRFESGKIG